LQLGSTSIGTQPAFSPTSGLFREQGLGLSGRNSSRHRRTNNRRRRRTSACPHGRYPARRRGPSGRAHRALRLPPARGQSGTAPAQTGLAPCAIAASCLGKVPGRTVDVLVARKDHQRIAQKTNDILACQADAAEPIGVVKVECRQRIPAGIGGPDRLENAVRLRRQKPMDELSAGGMALQIDLVAPGDACFAQWREDAAGDRL
jgi:hypothetical protein